MQRQQQQLQQNGRNEQLQAELVACVVCTNYLANVTSFVFFAAATNKLINSNKNKQKSLEI